MFIEATDSMHALMFAIAVLLTAAATALARIERYLRHGVEFSRNQQAEQVAVAEVTEGADNTVARRFASLEESLENVSSRQEELATVSRSEKSYENAVRLAKTGAGVEQITKNFGISKGEAQLLVRLHAAQAAAQSSTRSRSH